jgi:tetratricopeptide (TPR) repeat protein
MRNSGIDETASRVLARAKTGDVAGAIADGEAAIAEGKAHAGLVLFVGVMCCREGDAARGVQHLRVSHAAAPDNPVARVELARGLLAVGAYQEVQELTARYASTQTFADREMLRIHAHALRHLCRHEEACSEYETLVLLEPGDFESWNGLGVSRLALSDTSGAITALVEATRLRPAVASFLISLARAYAASLDWPLALTAARRAVALAPDDIAAGIVLARALAASNHLAEASQLLREARARADLTLEHRCEMAGVHAQLKEFAVAEAMYREVTATHPDATVAWVGLGKILERTNQSAALAATLEAAAAAGIAAEPLALLRARMLRKESRLEEALASAHSAPPDVDPVDRAQLIGQIADRLGRPEEAFAAFVEANAILAERDTGGREEAQAYLESLRKVREIMTPGWYAGWSPPVRLHSRRSPMFVFGFPRSGTTLIDTMLVGHPDTVVLEEEGIIQRMSDALGPVERLPGLSGAEINSMRDDYFAEVERLAPGMSDKLIVDKEPLGLASTALLHRLFPAARFVFAERHPCDVVLSCFITSSRLNAKVASFYDLVGTARLYDQVLGYWRHCCGVFPIGWHSVRYERLVADTEAELRRLAAFAGLDWTPQMLANDENAATRAYIGSPSYAQVSEPIYRRAAGRWEKYQRDMAPVIPLLKPWIDTLGYDLPDALA